MTTFNFISGTRHPGVTGNNPTQASLEWNNPQVLRQWNEKQILRRVAPQDDKNCVCCDDNSCIANFSPGVVGRLSHPA
jgi:hypothetical protein